MGSYRFKALIKKTLRKHLPSHIFEKLDLSEYHEYNNYTQITIVVKRVIDFPDDLSQYFEAADPPVVTLDLLKELEKLFDTKKISVSTGLRRNKRRSYIEQSIIRIEGASFKKVFDDGTVEWTIPIKDQWQMIDPEDLE
jgi:hypothetical protein